MPIRALLELLCHIAAAWKIQVFICSQSSFSSARAQDLYRRQTGRISCGDYNEFQILPPSKVETDFRKNQISEHFRCFQMLQLLFQPQPRLVEQSISSCLQPIVCAGMCLPRREFATFLGFCAALHSEAPVPARASSSLHFLLPTASTNCFLWKSKGDWNNEFSYSVCILELSGPLWLLHLQRFFCEECRATDTCACIYTCTKPPKMNFSPWDPVIGWWEWFRTLLKVYNGQQEAIFYWGTLNWDLYWEILTQIRLPRKEMDTPGLLVFKKGLENALNRL